MRKRIELTAHLTTDKKGPPIKANAAVCTGCRICQLRCSLKLEKAFNPSKAKIQICRQVNRDTEYAVFFTDECDNCGICVKYCPYEALTQEPKREGSLA